MSVGRQTGTCSPTGVGRNAISGASNVPMSMFMAVIGGWGAVSVALGLVVAAMIRHEERLVCRTGSSTPPGRRMPAPVAARRRTSQRRHHEAGSVS